MLLWPRQAQQKILPTGSSLNSSVTKPVSRFTRFSLTAQWQKGTTLQVSPPSNWLPSPELTSSSLTFYSSFKAHALFCNVPSHLIPKFFPSPATWIWTTWLLVFTYCPVVFNTMTSTLEKKKFSLGPWCFVTKIKTPRTKRSFMKNLSFFYCFLFMSYTQPDK